METGLWHVLLMDFSYQSLGGTPVLYAGHLPVRCVVVVVLVCPVSHSAFGLPGEALVAKMPPLMPASMWTRKDTKTFKDTVRKNADNVIKIGSLATATVSGAVLSVGPLNVVLWLFVL